MVIVRTVPGRIAAEENIGSVKLESVVKRIKEFRRDQVPRHEHIRALKTFRHHHPYYIRERWMKLGLGLLVWSALEVLNLAINDGGKVKWLFPDRIFIFYFSHFILFFLRNTALFFFFFITSSV